MYELFATLRLRACPIKPLVNVVPLLVADAPVTLSTSPPWKAQ